MPNDGSYCWFSELYNCHAVVKTLISRHHVQSNALPHGRGRALCWLGLWLWLCEPVLFLNVFLSVADHYSLVALVHALAGKVVERGMKVNAL